MSYTQIPSKMKTQVYADFDNIVFEGRHREYGAYQMRKRYNRYLIRALLVTFLAFVALTGFPKFADWLMPKEDAAPRELIHVTEVGPLPPPPPLTEDDPVEPLPPPPPTPPSVRTVAFLIPDPVPDDLVSDSATIADITALDSSVVALVDQDGDEPGDYNYNFDEFGTGDVPGEIFVKEEVDREIPADTFMILDSEPMAVNMDDLQKLIGYPPMAVEAEIEGKVVLRVYIDKRGDYKKHIVIKDPHPILTAAVSKQINKLKMTPGVQGGRPINVWVTVPFNFTLSR
jgi:protein TonB